MNKLVTIAAVLVALTGTAQAEQTLLPYLAIGGKVETVISETGTTNKYGATTSFDLNVAADAGNAFGSLNFVVDSANDLALDEWNVGTTVNNTMLSFGNQDNIWISTESGDTIEEPAMGTSLQVSAMGATVALGFDAVETDITDLENVQVAYSTYILIADVTGAADFNVDSDEWVVAGRADTAGMLDGVRLGGAVSYGSLSKTTSFEVDATVMGMTAYLNGDKDDLTQNVGASYTIGTDFSLEGAVNYDMNTEVVSPKLTLAFAF